MQVLVFILFNIPALIVLISAMQLCIKDRFESAMGKYMVLLLLSVGISMLLYAEYFNPFVTRKLCWGFDFMYCLLSPFCAPVYFLFLNRLTDTRRIPALNFAAFLPAILYATILITVNLVVTEADRHAYISNIILGQSIQMEPSLSYDWQVLIGNNIFKVFVPLQAILVMVYGEYRLKSFYAAQDITVGKRVNMAALSGIHTLSFLVAALCLFISIIPVYEITNEIWLVGGVMAFEIILVVLIASYVLRADFSANELLVKVVGGADAGQPDILNALPEESYPEPIRLQEYPTLIARIDAVMERENLFLKPELSLVSLAEHIGSNRTYVSKAIKDAKGCNFSDYVNRYRLEYALKLLKRTPKESIIIQNIAIQCGCGSIQTFYRYFKMLYGITPSQWIEQHR